MQGEEKRRQPRSWQRQPPHETATTRNAAHACISEIHEMVTEHGVAPLPVLYPEGGVQQRIVLLGGPGGSRWRPSPDSDCSAGSGDMRVVVPMGVTPCNAGR